MQKCQLTVLDDDYDPRVEGSETFEVFLSSAVGSTLARPYHSTVVIHDETLDGALTILPLAGLLGFLSFLLFLTISCCLV